jgi:hypothetical protein
MMVLLYTKVLPLQKYRACTADDGDDKIPDEKIIALLYNTKKHAFTPQYDRAVEIYPACCQAISSLPHMHLRVACVRWRWWYSADNPLDLSKGFRDVR